MNHKKFIDDFRRNTYGINLDGFIKQRNVLAEVLNNALEELSERMYEKDIHFVFELIQNAEDNLYNTKITPELSFMLLNQDPTDTLGCEGCLCVINNERGFIEENIRGISGIGQSTKTKQQGFIGEKGIGFKSVFIVSPKPHIFSNGYHFYFTDEPGEVGLKYIVPNWVDQLPEIVTKNKSSTVLLLPIRKEKYKDIVENISDITPEVLLFLSKLQGLSIEVGEHGQKKVMLRDQNEDNSVVELIIQEDVSNYETSYWLHNKTVVVPENIKEEKRKNIKDRQLTVAFPLSKEAEKGRVYAYLPTEVKTDFPFLINADFLLTANRETIRSNIPWNKWIKDELPKTIVSGLLAMASQDDYKKIVCKYIPIPNKTGMFSGFFHSVSSDVCKQLTSEPIILNDVGMIVKSCEVRLAKNSERALFPINNRPNFFEDCSFIHAEISHLDKQLKAIAVRDFSNDDFLSAVKDTDWLQKQDIKWFVCFFKYFLAINRTPSYSEIPMLPLEGGTFACSFDDIYVEQKLGELDTIRSALGGNIVSIKLVSHELIVALSNDEQLLKKIITYFGIKLLSLSRYIEEVIKSFCNNQEEKTKENILKVTGLIIQNWGSIEDTTKEFILTENFYCVEGNNPKKEGTFLVPRTFNKGSGWQVIFDDEECSECNILCTEYQDYFSDLPHYQEFLKEIFKATEFPTLKLVKIEERLDERKEFQPYFKILQDFLLKKYEPHGVVKENSFSINTYLIPSFLHRTENDCFDLNQVNAFIRWLENYIKKGVDPIEGCCEIILHRYNQRTIRLINFRETDVVNFFVWQLKNIAWVRSTHGLKRPIEIFKPTSTITNLFQSYLPYLEENISDELCGHLGIQTEITTASLVSFLNAISNKDDVNFKTVIKIYQFLESTASEKELDKIFNDYELIYLPNSKRRWYSAQGGVVWEDASKALGDLLGWLSPAYEGKKLKSFFIDKLGIPEKASEKSFIEAWGRLQKNVFSDVEIEAALTQIYPPIIDCITREEDYELWELWNEFVKTAKIWTNSKEFIEPALVLFDDDYDLTKIFQDKNIFFAWKPESESLGHLNKLYRELGVSAISDVVKIHPYQIKDKVKDSSSKFLTDSAKYLIAGLFYNADKARFIEFVDSEKLASLMFTSEYLVSVIDMRYEIVLNGERYSHIESGVSSFFDIKTGELLFNSSFDKEYISDDVSKRLSIWLMGNENLVDSIARCLGADEKRAFQLNKTGRYDLPTKIKEKLKEYIVIPQSNYKDSEEIKDASGATSDTDSRLDNEVPLQDKTDGFHRLDDDIFDKSEALEQNETEVVDNNSSSLESKTKESLREQSFSRKLKSRSRSISQKIKDQDYERIPIEVDFKPWCDEDRIQNEIIGKEAEAFVIKHESELGLEVTSMNSQQVDNAGYDLEIKVPDTGEIRWVEVKGTKGLWSNYGVGLTPLQIQCALENRGKFWIYVVENVGASKQRLYRIKDPARQFTRFRFGGEWKKYAVKIGVQSAVQTDEELIEELKSLTDDSGKKIIEFCVDNKLTLPEVGLEIEANDAVVGEIELAWPDSSFGLVYLKQEGAEKFSEWTLLEIDEVANNLNELVNNIVKSKNLGS
jgi:hypothetical protein